MGCGRDRDALSLPFSSISQDWKRLARSSVEEGSEAMIHSGAIDIAPTVWLCNACGE